MAGDWGIAFAGEVVMSWVVGSGHQARVRVDENRPSVFAGRDAIGGRTGGAGVGSVEGVVEGVVVGCNSLTRALPSALSLAARTMGPSGPLRNGTTATNEGSRNKLHCYHNSVAPSRSGVHGEVSAKDFQGQENRLPNLLTAPLATMILRNDVNRLYVCLFFSPPRAAGGQR